MSTCPDSDLFSAYVDGEIPSPWKEKLESHISSCESCANRTNRYERLHSVLSETMHTPEIDLEDSFHGSWNAETPGPS